MDMKKIKFKYGFILLFLLIVSFNTPLSAKGKNLKLFFDITTYAFEDFAFGGGAELRLNKFVSIKSTFDFTGPGGRIICLDGVFTFNTPIRLKPFFTIGYFDYFFKGNQSHDRDAIKSFTFGIGIDFNSKNDKSGVSLGVRFASSEGTTSGYFYCSLVLLKL